MDQESSLTPRWIVFGTALVYFSLGSLLTVHFMQLKQKWTDSRRVFQVQIYHAVPGKLLQERIRCGQHKAAFQRHVELQEAQHLIEGADATFTLPTDYSDTK
jgi:hypothetical protein